MDALQIGRNSDHRFESLQYMVATGSLGVLQLLQKVLQDVIQIFMNKMAKECL